MLGQPRPSRASIGGGDDGGDILQRHADVPQCGKGPRSRQLAQPVAAVAGAIIDLDRHEQANLVVVPQRLNRQPDSSANAPTPTNSPESTPAVSNPRPPEVKAGPLGPDRSVGRWLRPFAWIVRA